VDTSHHGDRAAAIERIGNRWRVGTAIAFVCLLAVSLVACAQAEASLSPPPAGNVSGTVLLKGVQADAPGAGLLVTALSRRPRVRPVSTHTAADGSFRLQLRPGWYLLAVDCWGAPATQIHVGDSGVTAAPIVALS
jgi:hypothetical protein